MRAMLLAKVATMTRPVERLHDLAERLADGPLRRRVARVLGARRVGQQADHALLAELGEDREVRQLAVDRGVVELEVAGVDDRSRPASGGRCPSRPGSSGRPGTATTVNGPIWTSSPGSSGEERVVVELVLLDLVAEEAAGERRGVDRHARELRQDVRQAADVVLVGVGDEERLDVGLRSLR